MVSVGAYQRVARDCPCPYQSIECKNLWRYQTRSVDKRRGRIYECHRVSYTVHTCAYTISKAASLSKFSHGAKNYVNKLVNLSSKLQWRQYSGTSLNMDTLETKIFVLISEVFLFQGRKVCIYIKLGLGQVS